MGKGVQLVLLRPSTGTLIMYTISHQGDMLEDGWVKYVSEG